MKRINCTIEPDYFEIFAVELNGYGFEITKRGEDRIEFTIYAQDEEFESIREMVEEIFADIGKGKVSSVEDISEEDWEEKWKESFKPIEIGKFIVVPEWEIYNGSDYIPIKIKVAMAFGTGLHPTTQMMLKLIPEFVESEDSVLDVGCGTGMLAIASAKMGAQVDALDIDPQAVEECKVNAWENEVSVRCFLGNIEEIDQEYDVLISNLQMEIFQRSFDTLSKKFRKYWLLSGIFQDVEREEILNLSREYNLKLVRIESMQEEGRDDHVWYGFVFKRS